MRICVFGSGAIGAYVGVLAHGAGAEVTLIARGAHLQAMRANGARLLLQGEEIVARPFCTDDPTEVQPPDYLVVAVEYVENGQEFDPEQLRAWQALATKVTLTEGESKPISLKLAR